MAHSDFSWRKIFSFIGTALLVLVAFVAFALGGNLIYGGQTFYGVMSLVAGGACGTLAVLLYLNYQKWADKNLASRKPTYKG